LSSNQVNQIIFNLEQYDKEEVSKSITSLIQTSGSLTSVELSQLKGISIILAKEQLMETESLGLLCRDESLEGIRFYENIFV
jgi:ESCRT-II complex subunit VPS36